MPDNSLEILMTFFMETISTAVCELYQVLSSCS